ncbi:MAG: response regulator [Bacteroidales bacterium]|jgi:CheY-like chemotaxis protein/signal transduction histidine kinase|nr:response regulator [Bacteroidales bacterium]
MNFIERIFQICTLNNDKIDPDSDNFYNAIIFNFFSFMALILLIVFISVNVYLKNSYLFIILASLFIAITINLVLFWKKYNSILASTILSALLSIFLLWLLYSGIVNNQGVILITLFPVLNIYLLGKKRGNIFSLIFFALSGIAILLPRIFSFQLVFSLTNQVLFVLLYFVFLIFLNIQEKISKLRFETIQSKIKKAKQETLAKEEFISKISHQIRTPLNNLVVVTNIVNNFDLDEKQKDLIDTIQASTNNLVNVVNNIAEISNVDLLQSKDYNQNFNLEVTVKNTIDLFHEENSDDLQFPVEISEDINFMVFGDPVKIKQVYLNLIETILKKTKAGKKTIDIKIKKLSESNNIVEILFNFSTVDMEQVSEITKILNTEKNKKDRNAAIAKLLECTIGMRIIETLGGSVDFNLSPYIFECNFILKFKKGESLIIKKEESKEFALPEIKSEGKVNLKDSNILLVEDNLINQKIVLLSLKKTVNSVEVANNGKEALDKFGSAKFDVILMDIQMPIMNGIVTTKKIRSIEKSTNTRTPIIAITANALLGDKEECLAAGMDDYISKPFQIETLITKMEQQLA